jgi:hypothetical protein
LTHEGKTFVIRGEGRPDAGSQIVRSKRRKSFVNEEWNRLRDIIDSLLSISTLVGLK